MFYRNKFLKYSSSDFNPKNGGYTTTKVHYRTMFINRYQSDQRTYLNKVLFNQTYFVATRLANSLSSYCIPSTEIYGIGCWCRTCGLNTF